MPIRMRGKSSVRISPATEIMPLCVPGRPVFRTRISPSGMSRSS